MKAFIKKFWNDTGVKPLAFVLPVIAVIWSTAWSIQDQSLNLWPFVFAAGTFLLLFIAKYLFRNNP